jgi:peptidoglycan/xylan/chitin deacetylase (PgdA/CDA1 family)
MGSPAVPKGGPPLIPNQFLYRNYYRIKPLVPRRLQIILRRLVALRQRKAHRQVWPIPPGAAQPPAGFPGWPGGKRFSLVLTHDVETARGVARVPRLMALEQELGFRSSFNFVARGYHLPVELRRQLAERGFEVGVHGLEHNYKLYESAAAFAGQAQEINRYLREWEAVGFRSPCVYHNFDWLHGLDLSYDASSFDWDPFQPQPDGVGTIFPLKMGGGPSGREYVELPYTLAQDFTIFVLFREKDIAIWQEKLRWIAGHGGMALLITHPDYMCFEGQSGFEEYPVELYLELLKHIRSEFSGEYWHPLPREMALFWKKSGLP